MGVVPSHRLSRQLLNSKPSRVLIQIFIHCSKTLYHFLLYSDDIAEIEEKTTQEKYQSIESLRIWRQTHGTFDLELLIDTLKQIRRKDIARDLVDYFSRQTRMWFWIKLWSFLLKIALYISYCPKLIYNLYITAFFLCF